MLSVFNDPTAALWATVLRVVSEALKEGYLITGYLNKETSSDTEINPILVEGRGDAY